MKVLLDESFPMALCRRLRDAGKDAEHVLELAVRGMRDEVLRAHLEAEPLVFLTHDEELEEIPGDFTSQVVISLLPPHQPIGERIETWCAAIERLHARRPPERLFEILPWGELVAWKILPFGRWSSMRPL